MPTNKLIPLKEFFQNPKRDLQFKLSPNSKKMGFIREHGNRLNIWVKDLESGKEVVLTKQQQRNIHDFDWKNNDQIIYYQDQDGDENDHLYIINLKTKKVTDLTPYKGVKVVGHYTFNLETIVKGKKKFENKIIIHHNKRDKSAFDIVLKDIVTKEEKMLYQSSVQKNVELFDYETLEPRYIKKLMPGGEVIYRVLSNGTEKKVLEYESGNSFAILDYNHDGQKLYVMSNLDADKLGLYETNLNLKNVTKIFEHDVVDLDYVAVHPISKKLMYATYYMAKNERHFFDQKLQTTYEHMTQKLVTDFPQEKDSQIAVHWNIYDPQTTLVTSYGDNHLPMEYLYLEDQKQFNALSVEHKYLNPQYLAPMKYINYQSRDGLTIYGYLTLPKNAQLPVPIIVNPHGGPWVRDRWGYNSEVQFLVNRGYGVLQPNFRISTGYGKEFFKKGWKQWGLACQDDVTDGTNWLIEQGYTKPGMIGIYGGSYGGYATLMGIIREPQLYSAAVDYVGVSDLFSFWDGFPDYWKAKGNIFEEAMGNPYENEELARNVSPIYHVDQIETPLMIVQGANDPRVPQKQADLIYNKLQERGVSVEYILKKDEGHGFANQENRLDLYQRMIKFFDKYLKE